MKTELKIYGNNIWFNVDLYDDEPLPLTKEVSMYKYILLIILTTNLIACTRVTPTPTTKPEPESGAVWEIPTP